MFQHTSGALLTKYSSHVKHLEESLYHNLHIHCHEELKTSYGDYYFCIVVMYMCKMDSTISNITTYNENSIIESRWDSPIFYATSFNNLPCCEGLVSHLHLLVVCASLD
jgi:hypothetical protein